MTIQVAVKLSYAGTYPVRDAALFIRATLEMGVLARLSTRHLHLWVREGLADSYLQGVRDRKIFLTFRDLISLRVVAALRASGIKPAVIRSLERELRVRFGWQHPFVMADFWTLPPDVVMKVDGRPALPTRNWQMALDFFMEYVRPAHGMSFDLFNEAATWTPTAGVLLDPKVQFGEPCIQGTRVPTQVIWAFYQAGDSVREIASAYGLLESQVESAIDWERKLQAAASS